MAKTRISNLWLLLFLLGMVCTTITAWNSSGYYHFDEHYQIIEFAGLKLGFNTADDLAWEYDSAVRPALQPAICYIILKSTSFIGLSDPYHQATLLRLLTGLLALLVISFFIKTTLHLIKPSLRTVYISLSYLLWFIPCISVRYSSETWSGLFFLLAVAVYYMPEKRRNLYIIVGALLALSFLFRFQSAILSMGFLLWLIIIKHEKFNRLAAVFASATAIFAIGILIDRWFYGRYVPAFWNYLVVNLIDGKAASFGVSPWYEILDYIITGPTIPLGLCILSAWIILLIKDRRNLIVWCVTPFLIIHMIIGHKELRFIFPLVFFVPIMLTQAIQQISNYTLLRKEYVINAGKVLLAFLLVVNGFAMLTILFKPADGGQKNITKFIATHYGNKPVRLFYTNYDNPYNPILPLKENFYLNRNVTIDQSDHIADLQGTKLSADTVYLLCTHEDPYVALSRQLPVLRSAHKTAGMYIWTKALADIQGYASRNNIPELYELYPADQDIH